MATQSSDYTFASAQAASIPSTVGILQLQDRDHSFWRRAASQPAHAGKFQSADGAWWELMRDQSVTPFMFGAVGVPATSDDTQELQNFFDFCDLARVSEANWEGQFGVSASLYLGGSTHSTASSPQEQARFTGEMSLLVKSNIDGAVLYNRTRSNAVFDRLNISPISDPGLVYDNKLFDFGLLFDSGAAQQTWSNITVGYARIWGVFIQTYGNLQVSNRADQNEIYQKKLRDNTFSNTILNCFFYGCGSGCEMSGTTYAADFKSSSFTVASRNDDWNSFAQSTTLSVAAMPPAIINNDILGTGYETTLYARINDQHYKITGLDYANSRISVFPVLPTGAGPGTVYYVFGGGFGSVGGDAGLTSVKGTANACATGFWNGAQYPGYFDVTVQHNVFGYTVGPWLASVALGGAARVYFEGNEVDFLWEATSESTAEHSILAQTAINPRKIRWFTPRLSDGSLAVFPRPKCVQINYRGRWLHTTADANDPGTANHYLGYARFYNPPEITSLRGHGGFIIQIEEFGTDHVPAANNSTFRDRFGFRAQYFLCSGSTNASGAPAGDITVQRVRNPHSGVPYGTLNGGTSDVTLSGPFTGPVLVCVEQATTGTDDYFAYVVAGKSGTGGLANDSVTNAVLANMAQATIKGRASGAGSGDPQDLTPAQARSVIASDSNNGGHFLAGDGTFKAPPAAAGWTVDYTSNRASYYNLTPASMTHLVFNTSNDGYHGVFLQNVATGTRFKMSRLRGGQSVSVYTSDQSQTLSRKTGTGANPTVADGGTVFLTKVAANLWVGEGDFEN